MVPDYITIEQYGKTDFTQVKEHPDPEDVKMAKAGLEKAREAMLSRKYDIIVLDEINTAHFFHLITIMRCWILLRINRMVWSWYSPADMRLKN